MAAEGLVVVVPERNGPNLGGDFDDLFADFQRVFTLDFQVKDFPFFQFGRVLEQLAGEDFITFIFHFPFLICCIWLPR